MLLMLPRPQISLRLWISNKAKVYPSKRPELARQFHSTPLHHSRSRTIESHHQPNAIASHSHSEPRIHYRVKTPSQSATIRVIMLQTESQQTSISPAPNALAPKAPRPGRSAKGGQGEGEEETRDSRVRRNPNIIRPKPPIEPQ